MYDELVGCHVMYSATFCTIRAIYCGYSDWWLRKLLSNNISLRTVVCGILRIVLLLSVLISYLFSSKQFLQ